MGVLNLAVVVLQQVGAVAVQDAGRAAVETGGMAAALQPFAGRFDADHGHIRIVEKGVEQPHGVGTAADAGDERVRQAVLRRQQLLARLATDHRLEIPHHARIGRRSRHGADDVEGVVDIGDPVAQRLVHGVLERRRAGVDGHDLGAEQAHALHVGLLALDVGGAHVDHAGHAQPRRHRGDGNAVHAGAGLGDQPAAAHAARQQRLPQRVVDLVRAGVIEILALQVELRAAEVFGQALGEVERRGATDIVTAQLVQPCLKGGVGPRLVVGGLDLADQRHQRFRDIAPAIASSCLAPIVRAAEKAMLVGEINPLFTHQSFPVSRFDELRLGW